MQEVPIHFDTIHEDAVVPQYATDGDAGLDLYSVETTTLAPGKRDSVGTGITMAIPKGYVGLVHPRSGLAFKHGISVANTPGTIDSGYRGEIRVLLINLGHDTISISKGDRIAQLVVQPVVKAVMIQHAISSDTERGTGGFGSTGV